MVKKNGIDMEGKKVVVLGNGGASQAIQAGVQIQGRVSVWISCRWIIRISLEKMLV